MKNPLKTAEAGKAVGVRNAKGEIICLWDSDNIIPESNWITKMLEPFADENIIASEPLGYKYRKQDSVVNRYTALLGMGDPLCMFLGKYDRYCGITGKWTNVPYEAIDEGNYLSIRFDEIIPTIGANGFFMRRNELVDNFEGDYLFDIDVLWNLFNKDKGLRVAKVKTEIVHLFCTDTKTFYRKQNRRIKDFLFFNESKGRTYPWNKSKKSGILLFGMSCITVVPLLIQAVVGYFRTGKKDLPDELIGKELVLRFLINRTLLLACFRDSTDSKSLDNARIAFVF